MLCNFLNTKISQNTGGVLARFKIFLLCFLNLFDTPAPNINLFVVCWFASLTKIITKLFFFIFNADLGPSPMCAEPRVTGLLASGTYLPPTGGSIVHHLQPLCFIDVSISYKHGTYYNKTLEAPEYYSTTTASWSKFFDNLWRRRSSLSINQLTKLCLAAIKLRYIFHRPSSTIFHVILQWRVCLLYTSPSPRD